MIEKERVKRTIEFNHPDRVPIAGIRDGDFFVLLPAPSKSWKIPPGSYPKVHDAIDALKVWRWKRPPGVPRDWRSYPREEVDEWGCYWNRQGNDITMGHPGRPCIENWEDLDNWRPPDYTLPERFEFFGKLAGYIPNKYLISCIEEGMGIFTRASMLRGFSNLLVDFMKYPKQVNQLLKMINETYLQSIENSLKYNPDATMIFDDLGTQSDVFISPAMFKKYFERYYREQISLAHDHGLHIILHSCGAINKYIPILIDWGLDVLEFDGPRMVGFDTIEKYNDRISFWGCVDLQTVYPFVTPAGVEEEVKTMISRMGTKDGGYVAYYYVDADRVLNVPRENMQAFITSVRKWGNYPLTWF